MSDNLNCQWATVKELTKIHPSFSEGGLRYLIFNAKTNGLENCLRKVGRKLLINLNDFQLWVENQKVGGQHA